MHEWQVLNLPLTACHLAEKQYQRQNRETGIIIQNVEDRLRYHGVQTTKELQVKKSHLQ